MLQATRVAARVRSWLACPAGGQIHSLFRRACNIAWGEWLITLHTPESGALPCGVMLDGEVDFLTLGLRPGLAVDWSPDDQCLYVGRRPVSLRRAAPLPMCGSVVAHLLGPGLRSANRGLLIDLVRRHGQGAVWAHLIERPTSGTSGRAVAAKRAWLGACGLCERIISGDRAAIRPVVAQVLGLGEGLTPAGDDLIVGIMAALYYGEAGLGAEQAACGRALGHAVAELAPATTTRVSANYLRLAALGGFSERVERAAATVLGEAAGRGVSVPVLHLLESGHSSGTDTAAGLYLGMSLLSTHRGESKWPLPPQG